jgi:PAS domain S-box-containing protein
MNPVAESLTGWTAAEAAGRPLPEVFSIISESTRKPVENLAERVLREGAVVVFSEPMLLLARDGTEWPIDDSGAPIRGERGVICGVVLVFRDVSARKCAEAERAQVHSQERAALAGALDRARNESLAMVSHELRTPLNAILGWSRLLRTRRLDSTTAARALEVIEHNAQAQAQLINDLLDLSRIATGKLRLELQSVDLPQIIEDAADSLRPAAEDKGLGLDLDLQPAASSVPGNVNRLRQVLWNLLSNAIRFTPEGGRIQITLRYTRSDARISIADTGQGIRADFRPHIFERFSQEDCTATRQHDGLGLGLAIVREIVELHGGTVGVESSGEGKGATFELTLPLSAGFNSANPEPAGQWLAAP